MDLTCKSSGWGTRVPVCTREHSFSFPLSTMGFLSESSAYLAQEPCPLLPPSQVSYSPFYVFLSFKHGLSSLKYEPEHSVYVSRELKPGKNKI